jgi:hypothetical protein
MIEQVAHMATEAQGEQGRGLPTDVAPVDIEGIMHQIRRNVEEKRAANVYRDDLWQGQPSLARADDPDCSMDEHLASLRAAGRVQIEGEPITSHRPILGIFIIKYKKFWRYWTRKYTDTLFLRQSLYNSEVAATLTAMNREIRELREEVRSLRDGRPTQGKSES